MSHRHYKIVNALKNREYDEDLDEEEDMDDEPYDDEQEQYVVSSTTSAKKPPSSAKGGKGTTGSGVKQKTMGGTATHQDCSAQPKFLMTDPDYDLLVALLPSVRAVVGQGTVSDERIAAALREANYDADIAVGIVVSEQPPPSSGKDKGNDRPGTDSVSSDHLKPSSSALSHQPVMPPVIRHTGKSRSLVIGSTSNPSQSSAAAVSSGKGNEATTKTPPSSSSAEQTRMSTEDRARSDVKTPSFSDGTRSAHNSGNLKVQQQLKAPSSNNNSGNLKAQQSAIDEQFFSPAAGGGGSTSTATTFPPGASPELVVDHDGKQTLSAIIAGHVDSGKSTILGHLLLKLGKFSQRDVQQLEKQAQSSGKESFKYAWLLDLGEEERRRGVTIDSGSQFFETAHKRVNILDCPGHKDFVLNMITSATQADVALLVVSSATGEFEAGLPHGTKEHLTVCRTLGVACYIVVVNKLDLVGYSEERFEFVRGEVLRLMAQLQIRKEKILGFVPVSGYQGLNLDGTPSQDGRTPQELLPWYKGPSLVELLDSTPSIKRSISAPLRITVQDVKNKTAFGHVESGIVRKGDTICFSPPMLQFQVKSIEKNDKGSTDEAIAGDTVEIHCATDLIGVYAGCVASGPNERVPSSTLMECHIQTLPNLERVILPGSEFTLVVHSVVECAVVTNLLSKMDKKGKTAQGMVKCIPANTQAMITLQTARHIAVEPAETSRALGRFVLRQDNETVAGGFIKRVVQQH